MTRVFPSLMEYQTFKDNALKQRVRAAIRLHQNKRRSKSFLHQIKKAALTAILVVTASTVALAAKTTKELKKEGYDCEAISGGIECRKGKDDLKYLCNSDGTGCQSYKVGIKVKSNADKVRDVKTPTKSLSTN